MVSVSRRAVEVQRVKVRVAIMYLVDFLGGGVEVMVPFVEALTVVRLVLEIVTVLWTIEVTVTVVMGVVLEVKVTVGETASTLGKPAVRKKSR